MDRHYPIQMFPCLQCFWKHIQHYVNGKSWHEGVGVEGYCPCGNPILGNSACVEESVRTYTVERLAPPLPLRTQRDQAELYLMLVTLVCYITGRIQTDLGISEYFPTLLVVVQVGGNPGDIDTTNLWGNKGKKSDTELGCFLS